MNREKIFQTLDQFLDQFKATPDFEDEFNRFKTNFRKSEVVTAFPGAFFFIGELIVDLALDYDTPMNSYCGTCTRCIDACPTQAITEPYVVDARKCISYLTIEFKDNLPEDLKDNFQNRVFGCDICQDVCPYNSKPLFHNEERFLPHPDFLEMSKDEWADITEDVFRKLFKKSAVKRTKFTGLKRNLDFIK